MSDDFSALVAGTDEIAYFKNGEESWRKKEKNFNPITIIDDKKAARFLILTENGVYELLKTNETHQSWGEELIEFASRFYSSKTDQQYSDEQIERGKNNLLNSIPPPSYAWMRYFVMFDPAPLFPSIECPVLALNGGKDCQVLAEKNINIRSLSVADTADFGILRLIVDKVDLAKKILKENHFTVGKTNVIAVEVHLLAVEMKKQIAGRDGVTAQDELDLRRTAHPGHRRRDHPGVLHPGRGVRSAGGVAVVVMEQTTTIQNRLGLHARPAAEFVKLSSRFSAKVTVEKDGLEVNGKSIMGVMMLAAGKGSSVELETEGSDEQAAMDALVALIEDKFGEGE